MRNPAEITAKPLVFATGLLVLAGLVSGCRTMFRTVDERFMAQPTAHRRVQVLPIWFEGAGTIDHSLSTNDLHTLCRQSGKDLARTIQQELQSKGYKVVGQLQIAHVDQMPSAPATEISSYLEAVRADFCENLLPQFPSPADGRPLTFQTNTTPGFFHYLVTRNPARVEHNPFHYEMTPLLTNVLTRVGATNSDAVLMVNTRAFFESEHHRTKRTVWNWTGGGLIATTELGVNLAIVAVGILAAANSPPPFVWVDPFWHSNNSLQYNIVLVDARTREVLWLNRNNFQHRDPSDTQVLADTVAGTLGDLPRIP